MNRPGRQIEEYFPKTVFTRHFQNLAGAKSGPELGTKRLCELLASLSPEELQEPIAPGKWSPAEVADHLVRAKICSSAASRDPGMGRTGCEEGG